VERDAGASGVGRTGRRNDQQTGHGANYGQLLPEALPE
jgi:hypothetical protein